MKINEELELGCNVTDIITDFSGIATGLCDYISGCSQILITPKISESGEHREGRWIDIQRVKRIGESKIILENNETPGPDISAPIK